MRLPCISPKAWLSILPGILLLSQPAQAGFTRLEPLPAPKMGLSSEAYPGGAYNPTNLTDNNPSTEYSSNNKGTNTFVELDFGSAKALSAFRHVDFAHSVESCQDGELAGGLYGTSLGNAFFGESMFSRVSNASKIAFVHLVWFLESENCSLIDCQLTTKHLLSFGAREVPRKEFLSMLGEALKHKTKKGRWQLSEGK